MSVMLAIFAGNLFFAQANAIVGNYGVALFDLTVAVSIVKVYEWTHPA